MDRLSKEGVSFRRAYANCPVCTPSRGTIFSGRHAHAGPVQNMFDVYKPTAPSLATMLREAGYHTAYFGKWHCGGVRNQKPPAMREEKPGRSPWCTRTPEFFRGGFQDWYGFEVINSFFESFAYRNAETNPRDLEGYQTDGLTDLVLTYLENYDREEPLYVVLSVEAPHFPLEAPEQFCRFDPDHLKVRANFVDRPGMREKLSVYYAMIENLDWNIGRVLEALEENPRFSGHTLTTYHSDHGEFMGSHGVFQKKLYPHEESVRIPSLFHWPEHLPARGPVEGLWSLVDFVPTLLGLIGLEVPSHVQGMDFSPRLRGEAFADREALLLEMVGNPRWSLDHLDWRGLVTDRWKYAFFETGHEILFDLEADPFEQTDLSRREPAEAERLRNRLLELLRATREPYFDVLIEHGVEPARPVFDVSKRKTDAATYPEDFNPARRDFIVRAPDSE